MYHCYLSCNFLTDTAPILLESTDLWTLLCDSAVSFDGWYGVWHCHATTEFSIPILYCIFWWRYVSHCTAANSWTMTACRLVSVSEWVSVCYLKKLVCCIHQRLPERKLWCFDFSGEYVEKTEVWLCGWYILGLYSRQVPVIPEQPLYLEWSHNYLFPYSF